METQINSILIDIEQQEASILMHCHELNRTLEMRMSAMEGLNILQAAQQCKSIRLSYDSPVGHIVKVEVGNR